MKEQHHMEKHLGQLIGKKVTALATDGDKDDYETFWGLVFSDGTVAWISRDSEGNGPGHLDIEKK